MTIFDYVLAAAHPTAVPGNNWTNTSGYNCVGVNLLPFHGNEILGLAIIYFALISMYCTTFIDVALKQCWPDKFLDSEVLKRVKKLQADFPGIMPGSNGKVKVVGHATEDIGKNDDAEEEWDAVVKVKKTSGEVGTVKYDRIVSQEPYVATCCVDEDMTFQLANNTAYGTVSEYCSATVRGYSALSTMLPMTGTFLGFLWCHNTMIDPIGDNHARYLSLVGYFLIFLTGTIMCGPASNTVHRKRNIILWTSIPTSSSLLHWHTKGVIGFCLVPMLGNLWQLLTIPHEKLLNSTGMWIGITAQLLGLAAFVGPQLLKKAGKITQVQSDCIGIIGEIIVVMASLLTFVQIETYSSAACAQSVTTFDTAVLGAIFLTLATLVVKHYAGAPVGPYTNDPSVLLMHYGTPVASSGPVPVLNYNREAAILPIIQPAGSQ